MNHRIINPRVVVVGMLLLMLMFVTIAAADDVTGSAQVTGGVFDYTAAENPAFGEAVLNGSDQTLTDDIVISVDDPTGSGSGWSLDISAAQFTDGLGHTLPASALRITEVAVTATSESAVAPDNSGQSYPVTVGSTATDFFAAAANTGMGAFNLTTTLTLSIPATTFAGNYTSAMVITAAQGP